jgi:excisionase family DNA binding protein
MAGVNGCPRCGRQLIPDGLSVLCLSHGEPSAPATVEPIESRPAHEPWAEWEREFAREKRDEMTIAQIAAAIGRSPKAVRHWYERQGIRKARVNRARPAPVDPGALEPRHGRWWREEEVAALEDGELDKVIQQRSRNAIYRKRHRLGLVRGDADGYMSLREVAAAFGISRSTVWRMVHRGQIEARRASSRLMRIDPADAEKAVASMRRRE